MQIMRANHSNCSNDRSFGMGTRVFVRLASNASVCEKIYTPF